MSISVSPRSTLKNEKGECVKMLQIVSAETEEMDHGQRGFTLLELSIVLVIIGLIMGGVMLGQDLIQAAAIRGTIKQIQTYDAAVNLFKDKYRDLPGDIVVTVNSSFQPRNGGVGRGDGNGLIAGGAAGSTALNSETVLFWRDLSSAGMIDASFTAATDAPAASLANPNAIRAYLPQAKIGRGNFIAVYAESSLNYYQIAGMATTDAGGYPLIAGSITPLEAFNIDTKVDDGLPNTGNALARHAAGPGVILNDVPQVGTCVDLATATGIYLTTTTANATAPVCSLRLSFFN